MIVTIKRADPGVGPSQEQENVSEMYCVTGVRTR